MSKTPKTIEELEAELTIARAYELWFKPAYTRFDVEALQKTHHHLFQDFKKYHLTNPPPGEFREYVDEGDWKKDRPLVSFGETANSYVCYSPMGEADLRELDQTLKSVRPDQLSKLKPKEFSAAMSKLYAKLDYIHPFHEGNSRALRVFTEQVARASGYRLDWEQFNRTPRSRDLLYIARDRAVGEHAIEHVRKPYAAEQLYLHMQKYSKYPSLENLITSISRPLRAISFEKKAPLLALREHPELAVAYKTMESANRYFLEKWPDNVPAQSAALKQTRQYIQSKLDLGETKDFHRPEALLNKNQAQMHVDALKQTPVHLEALLKNPVLANRPTADLERLAYWRGIVQESTNFKPESAQDDALRKFDKAAENPDFLKRLENSNEQVPIAKGRNIELSL
jgi:cell filamentation protein